MMSINRRTFVKRCLMGGCGLALGTYTVWDLIHEGEERQLRIGFPNDAPATLWRWSREADWYITRGRMVQCKLCPHDCILSENDRGFCRTRVVKNRKLYTIAYGNPCSIHIDPVEKKPLYHFLPGAPIFSIATAGCNLRCLNCQNWEISQAAPEKTTNFDLPPARLVAITAQRKIPLIAYTYSEPIIFYEYVKDTAALARERGIRNVLVTAGYISERPLRELCRVTDAATVDVKAFNDRFFKKVTGSKRDPVLRALEVMREEGIWLEVSRLIVSTLSDDMEDIRSMCRWFVRTLGPDTPLHFLRFHPDYKLKGLPPTPVDALDRARQIALDSGLHFVYVGNVPGHPAQDTLCPRCGRSIIERQGFRITNNLLKGGLCPFCNHPIAGIWS